MFLACGRVCEPKGLPNIERENGDKNQRQIKKIAVHILHDQREGIFDKVIMARFSDRAGERVGPESLVVRAAIVVAGKTKPARDPKDQKGRGPEQPLGPPGRFWAEPAVRGVAKKLRRVKGG